MTNTINIHILEDMKALFVILGVDNYALPVRFRIHGSQIECRVPTWSGVVDLLEKAGDVTLVAVQDINGKLKWIFLRGSGSLVEKPSWEDFVHSKFGRIDPEDMFQIVSIQPKRMELYDEGRGWGFRETTDFLTH